VAKFIAQKFHSPACLNSSCTPNGSGVVCVPMAGLNQFGCNSRGTLKVNSVNGTAATAKADLKNNGFLLSPLCGLAS
jgi:hypothetical protein